jgi:hypothetical protein
VRTGAAGQAPRDGCAVYGLEKKGFTQRRRGRCELVSWRFRAIDDTLEAIFQEVFSDKDQQPRAETG